MNELLIKKRKGSYFSRSEQPLVISNVIYHPVVSLDRHDNPVSQIMFPDFTYSMVHHPMKNYTRESANIYRGRDCFVRVNAYRPESETAAHHITIMTAIGDFDAWWGDGELGDISVPDAIKDHPDYKHHIDYLKKEMRAGYGHEQDDCEAAFIMLSMGILQMMDHSSDPLISNFWYDKIAWEAKKKQLEEERLSRRRRY